ncbi:hypothetical protein [Actinomadura livida]|uniref:Uncharacterized protein n=1 Tax=Actinomadura livida TaxID=79909 RepID=A0A7W7I8Y2_9ACTN|nr:MULTISPECIES: hypothetical protein [Actinomadura]MBB4772368.1 hypothetical protein [Actinomadura catellatispora]
MRRLFASACLALLLPPAATTCTHLFGERVSLRIDRCERQPRYGHECHGSWTDAGGERHTTTVSHVGPEDVGETVGARLGPWPMDAHAGSLWADAPLYLPVPVLAAAVPFYLLLRWRFDREVKDTARRLLDAPEHFLVLEVNRKGAVRTGGEQHLRVRFGDPDVPVPEGADRRRFASARRPGGEIAFAVERRSDQLLMLDADGRPEAIVPHLGLQSDRPRVEAPDGRLLGEMPRTRGHTGDVHSVLDAGGTEVGRFARLRRGTWALCLSPDCSAVLADSVLAYLFTDGRAA